MHWDIGVLGGMALLTCDCSESSWSHENYMERAMGTLIFTVKTVYSVEGGGVWSIIVYISSRKTYRKIEVR